MVLYFSDIFLKNIRYRGSVGTYLQNNNSGCPFSLSRLKVSSSPLIPYVNLSAHKATPGAECALSHYSGDDSSQNFHSELDSVQDESNCYCPETVFLWTNWAFQSKYFI